MNLHRFWDGVITSSQNLTRLRNEAMALRNRQEFQRSQLTELASTGFQSWAKESFENPNVNDLVISVLVAVQDVVVLIAEPASTSSGIRANAALAHVQSFRRKVCPDYPPVQ